MTKWTSQSPERLSLRAAGPPALTAALWEQVMDLVLCVVAFLCPSNCCVSKCCVVSFFYSVFVTLVSACVCCLFYIGACFVNLGMALDYSFLILSFYNLFQEASVDFICIC